jgi:sugar-phosphatase
VPTLTASALLFDMDGTLVDSTAVVERVWARFARRHGLDVAAILANSHGVRMADTVEQWLPVGTDARAVIRDLSDYEWSDDDGVVAIPGAAEFLASLPLSSCALVTSASRALAVKRMASVGLPVPTVLVPAEDVERGKPHPDPYLAAAAMLGVAASDALVFEDAAAGIRSGLDAGMRVIVVGGLVDPITDGLPSIADYRQITASQQSDGTIAVAID